MPVLFPRFTNVHWKIDDVLQFPGQSALEQHHGLIKVFSDHDEMEDTGEVAQLGLKVVGIFEGLELQSKVMRQATVGHVAIGGVPTVDVRQVGQ